MKRTAWIFLAISAVALGSAPHLHARLRPRYGDTLRVETRMLLSMSSQPSLLTSETLTSLDDQGRLHPWLADRWESQDDGRRWVFYLHPRIAFSDGSALNGSAVASALGEKSGVWKSVHGDANSVIFEFDIQNLNLPALLASQEFSIAKTSAEGIPIGTGPFKVATRSTSSEVFDANESYWNGRPYLDHIELYAERSIRAQWVDVGLDRADLVEVPGESIRRAQQDRLHTESRADSELVAIVVSPDVKDQAALQALSLSIDRGTLAGVVFQKQGIAAAALLPQSMTGYAKLFGSGSDAAAARAARAQSSTTSLVLSYPPNDAALQLAAERIALNAREIGITIVPRAASGSPAQLSLTRMPLPSSDPSACIDELSRTAGPPMSAVAQNAEDEYAAEKQLLERYRLIPIAHLPSAYATSPRVQDFAIGWSGPDFKNLWIEERR